MSAIIHESKELPITNGVINVDSTSGSIVIYMKKGNLGDVLTINKVSKDGNMIYLYCDDNIINRNNIVVFGADRHAKIGYAKNRSIQMKWEIDYWKITKEL